MPSPSRVKIEIDDRDVRRTFREFPKEANQGINRAFASIGSAFNAKFSRERLGPGGVRIRRKGVTKKKRPGQPTLPKKMGLAGFKTVVIGQPRLEGKYFETATRSPIMIAHETGATIRGKSELGLAIPFSNKRSKSVTKAERKNAVLIQGASGPLLVVIKPNGKVVPIVHFERSVTLKKRLGFLATWRNFQPELDRRLSAALAQIMKRAGRRSGGRKK